MKRTLLRCSIILSPILIGSVLIGCGKAVKSANVNSESAIESNVSEDSNNIEVTITPTETPAAADVQKATITPETTLTPEATATPETTNTSEAYDYLTPVPESEAVDDTYFNDAVFIGNSRTEGFILYSGLSDTTAYTSRGVMVNTVFTEKSIRMNGKKVSIMDALAQTTFSKVYIMLGINELGWNATSVFKDKYSKIIDKVREINPDAKIYVQSILPVTKKKSDSDSTYNMKHVNEFNDIVKEVAQEKEVFYVNVSEGVADEKGYLPEEAAWDGIHLKQDYCKIWLKYLKCHVVK